MSAQQQLVELIRIARETPCLGSLQAAEFIRDHGPAIAELIEECSRKPEYDGQAKRYNVTGFGIDIQFLTFSAAAAFIRVRTAAALRKLTQD